jgi:hypothetical protein
MKYDIWDDDKRSQIGFKADRTMALDLLQKVGGLDREKAEEFLDQAGEPDDLALLRYGFTVDAVVD